MDSLIGETAEIIARSRSTGALTGAGISVESGIPDFRSAGGLWSKYDPAEYASIGAFLEDPVKIWKMLREMEGLILGAKPNRAHTGMGEMERMGFLHFIITQNVDNLHQDGGARNVIEYHGNSSTLSCLRCGKRYSAQEKGSEFPPRCTCREVLKPDVVFFGEAIPPEALSRSYELAASAQALMVVGTSAVVSPANSIPAIAKRNGAKVIEINKERTYLTGTLTDVFIEGSAGNVISALVDRLKELSTASKER